jgi:calcium-translocating P-type ATPase
VRIQALSPAEALASLQSGSDGLSEAEAARRLREYGPNRVERVGGVPAWRRLLEGFTHFFALILWVAGALAFFAEWRQPGEGMATLGAAILGVILVNGLFSFWQEERAERALAALQRLLPHRVEVQREGRSRAVAATEVVPGDLVFLAAGDDVPADCRVIEAFGVRVNTATVTGEALPRACEAGAVADEDLLAARNLLLAGTSLVSGEARAVVFATGMRTELGRIAHLAQPGPGRRLSPLQREIVRLSRLVAGLALAVGAAFFALGYALGLSFWQNLLFAVGIIVANVPEGLLPTVTLALAMGAQRMARRNALVRHLPSVETLGSTTVICTDKTGTLTENRLRAVRLFLAGEWVDVVDPAVLREQAARQPRTFEALRLCHSLKPVAQGAAGDWMGDPLEAALLALGRAGAGDPPAWPRVGEWPFDSDRRRFSARHRTPAGDRVYAKGALEALLPLSTRALQGQEAGPLGPGAAAAWQRAQEEMAGAGLRVIAVAWRDLAGPAGEGEGEGEVEADLTLAALVGLADPPRPEVPGAIARCQRAGIRVIMVTGDHPSTALAVAREIGLARNEPRVVTGQILARMSDTQLQLALDAPEILFARIGADQKQRIVAALKRKGEVVAVTGDGVNDAPALRHADIGIAMGRSGTDVAKAAADMVLLDDNFATIVAAVDEGRSVFANIRKFLTYILTSNIPEIVPYLAFVLFRIPLPLTVVQILAVDLGTDLLPALALGAERPDPRLMREPPRDPRERLVDWGLVARAYLFLGPLEAAAGMAAFFFVLAAGGWSYGESLAREAPLYLQATTACLAGIVVTQVVNVFLCRHERDSIRRTGLGGNRLLLAGVAVEVAALALIVYSPGGQALFGTAPLGPAVWVFLLPFAAAMLLAEELRKAWVRRRRGPQARAGVTGCDTRIPPPVESSGRAR